LAIRSTSPARRSRAVWAAPSRIRGRLWPSPLRARKGAPNVLFISSTTRASATRVLWRPDPHAEHRQARQERPAVHRHAHDRALFAFAILHADRSAIIIPTRCLALPRDRPAFRRQWRDTVRERFSLRNALAAGIRHLLHRQVASDARRGKSAPPAPTTAGRWARLRALLRLSRRRHPSNIIPISSTTIIRSNRRKTPEEGYHLTADLADKAIGFIADLKQVAPDKPFFSTLRRERTMLPTMFRRNGRTNQGQVRRGLGRLSREGLSLSKKELGIMPKGRQAVPGTIPTCRNWSKLPPTSANSMRE